MTKNGMAVYEAIGKARWDAAYLTGMLQAIGDEADARELQNVRKLADGLLTAIREAHNLAVSA